MPVDRLTGLMPLHITPLPTGPEKTHKDHVLFPREDPVFEHTTKGDVPRNMRLASFVGRSLVDQELFGISTEVDETIGSFVETRSIRLRRSLGYDLLILSAHKSVENIQSTYEHAHKYGFLHPKAHFDASEAVQEQIAMGSSEWQHKLINALHRQLKVRALQTGVDEFPEAVAA